MRRGLRMMGWVLLTAAATYVVAEWSVLYKSGLHDLRAADAAVGGSGVGAGLFKAVPVEPERVALQAQVDQLAQTFGQYRSVKERQIADLLKLVANLERQIQVLTAQRAPMEQVAALRAASRPVRWNRVEQDGTHQQRGTVVAPTQQGSDAAPPSLFQLARAVGFTKVEVRR